MGEPKQAAAQATASRAIQPCPAAPPGFEECFRSWFRELVKTAMYVGAAREEAEDAAAKTMMEMLPRWTMRRFTLAYARKAVVHNFLKEKTRGPARVARRLVERGHVPHHEGAEDSRLVEYENEEWLADVLGCLSPAQREVVECIVRGVDRDEIAKVLGKSKEVVRRHLCDARARLAEELNPGREAEQPPPRMARSPREEAS